MKKLSLSEKLAALSEANQLMENVKIFQTLDDIQRSVGCCTRATEMRNTVFACQQKEIEETERRLDNISGDQVLLLSDVVRGRITPEMAKRKFYRLLKSSAKLNRHLSDLKTWKA